MIAVLLIALAVVLLGLAGVWIVLAREDNRITSEPWMPGLTIRSRRLELATLGMQTTVLLERAEQILGCK